jgi:predicted enzyme related to lactoylglutathione lyase
MSMGGWIWYELLTSDVAAARAFYGKVIGWDFLQHETVPGYQMFAAQGVTIGGVMALPPETGLPRPLWLGYVRVADVDATVAAMQRDGATTCVPPTDIPGVGRFALILDPQGVPVYVMAPQSADGQSQSFAAKVGHCQWNELVTSDPVAAVEFHVRHLGWQKGDVMSMGPLGDYQFLIGGGERFGAAMKRTSGGPPLWRYYFGVDDIDRAARAIVDGGGKLLQEPQQVPGGGWAAAAIDPQGAEFGIAGPRKG